VKICYFDESGTGNEPVAVVTGVVVDTQRMHVTKEHWSSLLSKLSDICGRQLDELHTRDFYTGSGPFRQMAGPDRAQYIQETVEWFCAPSTASFLALSTRRNLQLRSPWAKCIRSSRRLGAPVRFIAY